MSCKIKPVLIEQAIGNTPFYKELVSKFPTNQDLWACFYRIFNVSGEEKSNKSVEFIESSGNYAQRTRENANWSDITLALATDFNTAGEKLTKTAAGNKYVSSVINPKLNLNDLAEGIAVDLAYQMDDKNKTKNIKLNIAGNGLYTLAKNYTQEELNNLLYKVLRSLIFNGITISEIRSGGQTGIDEAGIVAAQRLGIKCSVNAPKGFLFRNKEGQDISNEKQFKERFNINVEEKQSIGFSEQFKNYYSKHYEGQLPSMKSDDIFKVQELIQAVLEFNNTQNPNGNNTILENDYTDLAVGYTNGNVTRVQGIKISQGRIFDIYYKLRYGTSKEDLEKLYQISSYDKATKEIYQSEVITSLLSTLIKRNGLNQSIFDSITDDEIDTKVQMLLDEGCDESIADTLACDICYLDKVKEELGDDVSSSDLNLINLINEMLNFDTIDMNGEEIKVRDDLFNRIWNSPLLNQIPLKDSNISKEQLDELQSVTFDVQEEEVNDDYDNTIRDLNDKLGIDYSTYKMHLTPEIKILLEHLNDVESSEVNDFKLATKLDASVVAALLYKTIDNTSLRAMLNSIKTISENIPGFKGLTQLYEELSKDLDLATKFYINFNKYLMPAIQVRFDGTTVEIDNNKNVISREEALRYQYYADFRRKSLYANKENADKKLRNILQIENSYNTLKNDKLRNKLLKQLTDLYKDYIPTIDYANLANFVIKSTDESQAIKNLIGLIQRFVDEADDIRKSFASNKESILNSDILTQAAKSNLNELVSNLLPYSNPVTELTVSNALGKQHSALQNNSYLTRFMRQLKSDLNSDPNNPNSPLNKLGAYLKQTNQYLNSGIILEHRDENGELINPGLFTINNNGDWVATSYAKTLLDLADFDGIIDAIGNGLTYSKTSKGDYILSGYEMFFSGRQAKGVDYELAPYMLKTPSDASHNYALYAPITRVDSSDKKTRLFNYDENLVNKRTNELFNKIKFISSKDNNIAKSSIDLSYDEFMDFLKNGEYVLYGLDINSLNKNKNYLTFEVENRGATLTLLVEGTYDEQTKTFKRNSTNYLNVVEKSDTNTKEFVKNTIKYDIVNRRHIHIDNEGNWLNKGINKNHALFKQMRNAFVQEMQNAADAINAMFNHVNGVFTINDLKKTDTEMMKILFENYHFGEVKINGEKVYKITHNGKLLGKVFTSDRFTLKDADGNLVNYMTKVFEVDGKKYQVISDEVPNALNGEEQIYSINFLYGGAAAHLHINDNGYVEFTDEQNEAIDYAISQYILDYVDNTKQRLAAYSDMATNTSMTSDDNVAEYALNYKITYINTADLFDGDSKFYKSTQDGFKRFKEVQAGGLSYGIFDMNLDRPNDDSEKQLVEDSYLNSDEVQNLFESYGLTDCKQYTTFTGVVVNDRIYTNKKENSIISKKLADAIYNSGDFSRKQAEDRAKDIMKGFEDVDTDNAQSYITLEEWIRRIAARGQLKENLPLIQKLLDKNAPISAEELSTFVQVQKNFYYDLHYDANTKVITPRQIKNAEFVLVPRFIEGTQLQTLYEKMKAAGVDQINTKETSKAGKSKTITIWTKDDNISQKIGEDLKANKEVYSYNYLYTQQETPQHMDDVNKAGVQIIKKIIDNIDENDGTSLGNAKKRFLKNFSANIKDSFISLMDELMDDAKNSLDENGNVVIEGETIKGINYVHLLDRLRTELIRVNADSNSLDYVSLIDNAFETVAGQAYNIGIITKMPTIFPSVKNRLESAAQAIFNNGIIRQTLPGFHAAQITGVGFKPLSDKVSSYRKSNRLNYHVSADKYVSNIEVMVPASAFGLSFDSPKYANLSREEAKKKMLEDIQAAELDQIIGYRIPTEGKQSICLMKVVDLLDDTQGSTIVVPDGWVAQTGADFDIDSVYTIMHENFVDNDGNIHKYKSNKNQRKLRNNEIVDDLITILSDEKTIEEGLSQSKTKDVTDAKDKLLKDSYVERERENRSVYDVLDQAEFQSEGLQGRDLKAISVNRDGFNSICNTVKPILTKPITIVYKLDAEQLKFAKKAFDKIEKVGDGLYAITHNTWGWTKNNRNIDGALLLPYSSETTAHMLDAVKIGHIPNVNTETFKVYKTFVDIGSNFDMALAFITQPVISAFIDKYNHKNSIYSNDKTDPIKQTYIEIAKSLGINTDKLSKKQIKDLISNELQNEIEKIGNVLNYDTLKNRINSNTPVKGNVDRNQAAIDYLVLDQYEYIESLSSDAETYANVLRPDKFGAKVTLWQTRKVFKDINKILEKEPLFTTDGKDILEAIYPGVSEGLENYISSDLDSQSKYAPLHYCLKYGTATSLYVNKMLFPTESDDFVDLVDYLADALNINELNEELYKDFESYILSYIYNKVGTISMPIYLKDGNVKVQDAENDIQKAALQEAEMKRIFGYRHILNESNPTTFKVKDINYPTKEELKEFMAFSPAEKVEWVKQTFNDSLVCKYLTFRTHIPTTYQEKYQACQTLSFNEDNVGPETVYDEFNKTFNNTNPFLALTAVDIIKYAFVVEGFRTKKHSINRTIKNSVLTSDNSNYGLGIIEDLKKQFNIFVTTITDKVKEDLTEQFIRSHTNIKELNNIYLNKNDLKRYILNNKTLKYFDETNNKEVVLDIIAIPKNNETQSFIEKLKTYNIIRSYNNSALYRAEDADDVIYLYPLSRLQNNESGNISWNDKNNIGYQTPLYYITQIQKDIHNRQASLNGDELEEFDEPSQTKIQPIKERKIELTEKELTYPDVVNLLDVAATETSNSFVYKAQYDNNIFNSKLGNYKNHRILTINDTREGGTGNIYTIRYINWKDVNAFTNETFIRNLKAHAKRLNISIDEALNKDSKFKAKSDSFKEIIRQAVHLIVDNGNESSRGLRNVYIVSKQNRYQATLEEGVVYAAKSNYRDAIYGDDPAVQSYRKTLNDLGVNLRENDLDSTDDVKVKNTVQRNLENICLATSVLVKKQVADIEDRLEHFTKIDETWVPINDDRVLEAIKTDSRLHAQYLTLLLDAQKLIDRYTDETYDFRKLIASNASSINKKAIESINEQIAELTKNTLLSEAEELYVKTYLTSVSDNPNVKQGLSTLFDSYHETSLFTSHIADLQDTHNPILQVLTTDVMGDIRAKELQAEQTAEAFIKAYDDILNRAKASGRPININHIIDDYGRLIQNYNKHFEEDLENFNKTSTKLYEDYLVADEAYDANPNKNTKFARYKAYKKYLEHQLAFDKWKLKNINQEVKDSYIREQINFTEEILKNHPDIFVEYSILNNKKNILLKNKDNSIDDNYDDKINAIDKQINDLLSLWNKQEDVIDWDEKEEYKGSEAENATTHEEKLNSLDAAQDLRGYIQQSSRLNSAIYERKEKDIFRETLNKNLDTINKAEAPKQATDGRYYIPSQQVLMEDENYRKAKQWIYENAMFFYGGLLTNKVLDNKDRDKILFKFFNNKEKMDYADKIAADPNMSKEDKQKLIEEYSTRIAAALKYFEVEVGKKRKAERLYKTLAKDNKAYDEYGIINGFKFSDADIERIRKDETFRRNILESATLSTRSIVHVRPKEEDNVIYTRNFYAGMRADGIENLQYKNIVKSLNEILVHAINPQTEQFDPSLLTAEDLQKVLDILEEDFGFDSEDRTFDYKKATKKKTNVSKASVKKVQDFIKNNVEYVINQEAFDAAEKEIKTKPQSYQDLWYKVNTEYDENTGTYVPNHLFWGYAKPKDGAVDENGNSFIDKKKTAALQILKDAFKEEYTKYYYDAREQAKAAGTEAFNAWFEKNHIYNPNTDSFEPLPIWLTSKPTVNTPGDWMPKFGMTNKVVSDKAKNTYFNPDGSRKSNFKSKDQIQRIRDEHLDDEDEFSYEMSASEKEEILKQYTPDSRYFTDETVLSKEEKELKDLIYNTIVSVSKNKKALRRINEGWLPSKAEPKSKSITDPSLWLEELGKAMGIISNYNGREDWKRNISYDEDYVPNMPMSDFLKSVESSKEAEPKPERKEGQSIEDYNKQLDEWRKREELRKQKDLDIHKDLLDKNWKNVIADFIKQAAHYNAVQENKLKLYFGQKLIDDYGTYVQATNKKGIGKHLTRRSGVYEKVKDKNLQEQYANWIRRVVFNQFKNPQGWRTKLMQIAQSITSTQYMTINIRAGVSNVTVGESNIIAEAFANEYFGVKALNEATGVYMSGLADYMAHMYDEVSNTKVGAIIKGMNVIDWTEITGQVRMLNPEEFSKRLRDAAFGPLTAGEHFMQNRGMIAMMKSHRVVLLYDGVYKVMNEKEYARYITEDLYKEFATDAEKQAFEAEKQKIINDPNLQKEYVEFRKDLVTEFLLKFDRKRQQDFVKRRKEVLKQKQEEFKTNPTVWDQLALSKDGKMTFADGSIFKALHEQFLKDKAEGKTNAEVSQAYELLGRFKGRIIDVNKKIHGWYDKFSAAKIESGLLGGLIMQYHKHLVPGFLKRYRTAGYFNESRGTVEKGFYPSIINFLKLNFQNIKDPDIEGKEKDLLTGLQNIVGYCVDFCRYVKLTYDLLPDYEQANLRRSWGDVVGIVVGIGIALLANLGFDDDDDDAFLPNFFLYEADRLVSECWMWNPIGAYSEIKKLYANPVAFTANIGDLMNTLEVISGMLFGGEDYDPIVPTGRYAGRHKLGVYIERRIPYWRNIQSIMDISKNNKYYKLGGNPLSLIPMKNDRVK